MEVLTISALNNLKAKSTNNKQQMKRDENPISAYTQMEIMPNMPMSNYNINFGCKKNIEFGDDIPSQVKALREYGCEVKVVEKKDPKTGKITPKIIIDKFVVIDENSNIDYNKLLSNVIKITDKLSIMCTNTITSLPSLEEIGTLNAMGSSSFESAPNLKKADRIFISDTKRCTIFENLEQVKFLEMDRSNFESAPKLMSGEIYCSSYDHFNKDSLPEGNNVKIYYDCCHLTIHPELLVHDN